MSLETHLNFRSLPGMVTNYARVITSGKPLIAPEGTAMGRTVVKVARVRVRAGHVAKYRAVCGIPDALTLPHAFPHVLAMPLHMYIFTSPGFPVKVLGLIHLRNTIRCYRSIPNDSELALRAECDTMRETPIGQEYDIITRCEVQGELVWEEVSTMLARRASPGQRPTIERAGDAEIKSTLDVAANTGRRYARVSGDFNPIHLSARTASWFGFKQAVAHGMWSMSRSLGGAAAQLPSEPLQIDTQFKLPLYLPSGVIFRCQRNDNQVTTSLSSAKGDRMHLATQIRRM
jgi:acyl dehydratase